MRKKQVKPIRKEKRYRNYEADSLMRAYEAVKDKKMSVRRAAFVFRVPAQTLRDRVKGYVDAQKLKSGGVRDTVFSHEEEMTLVEHIETMAQLGYGHTNGRLQQTAGELALALGKRPTSKSLSNNWLYGFLKRWDHRIANVKPRALDTYRAKSTTPESIDSYFHNLETIMKNYNLTDKPQFIYNVDETGIQPEHRPPNVIAPVNSKPPAITSPRSTTTTVIGCVNAIGNALPPFFIFKGVQFFPDLMKGASPGAKGVMSKSGWSNSDIFKTYLKDHFLPSIPRGADDNQHVLLLLDGHASHVSPGLIEWANSKKIILFILPAHTSHVLQPLDVAVFGPFKNCYYHECAAFMRSHLGQTVTRYQMCEIACKAYTKAASSSNILSGFKKTGICPLAKDIIAPEKLYPSEPFREDSPVEKVTAMKMGKEAIQQFLLQKVEKQQVCCTCKCKLAENEKEITKSKKPSPSGKAITEGSFTAQLKQHEKEKQQGKSGKRQNKTCSPRPSTSGIQNNINPNRNSDTEDEDSPMDVSDLCCVCGKFSPPNLNARPYLKIVNWAECDSCGHWVHLAFCTKQTVVRRNDRFFCHHCC